MKRHFLLSLFLAINILIFAQAGFSINENESVMVYSLPQTELCIEVEVEKVSQVPGEFYRFSERYLATANVIAEEKTTYQVKNIKILSRAIPDPSRTYTVALSKKMPFDKITVNEKGILCGVNVDGCPEKRQEPVKKATKDPLARKTDKKDNVLPLTEEYMMASSTTKMAEGAAKTIYRIRESRISLLTGDVDQLPADGSSMRQMLNEMDRLEKELTELFTGKRTSETETHKIYITPNAIKRNEVAFRVSAQKGLVSSEDLSGSPYYITILPETIQTAPSKKGPQQTELKTILPARTQVTVSDGRNELASKTLYMPQFGKEIPVPADMFKGGREMRIDPNTGRILSIE